MKYLNQLFLALCFLFFSNISKAQFIYSDLLSLARGNPAANIMVGNTHGRYYWAVGIDWIYDIGSFDKKLAQPSGAFIVKLGLSDEEDWWKINYGIQQMYSKINEYHLEYSLIERHKSATYKKSHDKITILGFFEFEINLSEHIFIGIQTAVGCAIITSTEIKEVGSKSGLEKGNNFPFFAHLYHHVDHYNYDSQKVALAPRLGFHLGYRF